VVLSLRFIVKVFLSCFGKDKSWRYVRTQRSVLGRGYVIFEMECAYRGVEGLLR
jgi:hypothetical protein